MMTEYVWVWSEQNGLQKFNPNMDPSLDAGVFAEHYTTAIYFYPMEGI